MEEKVSKMSTVAVLFAMFLPAMLGISRGYSLPRSFQADEDLVAAFLKAILREKKECTLLFAHDYTYLPPLFIELLQERRDLTVHASLVGADQTLCNESEGDSSGKLAEKSWFSWLHRPCAIRQGNCVIAAFIFESGKQQDVMEMAARYVLFQTDKDRYVLWNRDGSQRVDDILLHPHAANTLLYKVAVTPMSGHALQLTTLCFFCKGGQPEIHSLGKLLSGQSISIENIFPDLSRNLNGKFMPSLGYIYSSPQQMESERARLEPKFFALSYLLEFAKVLNFDWVVNQVDTSVPAETKLSNGTWTGMAGAMLYGKIEFSPVSLFNFKLVDIMEMPGAVAYDSFAQLSRRPRPTYSWKAIIAPYTPSMWALIFTACFTSSVVFWLLFRMHFKVDNSFQSQSPPKSTLLYSLRFLFSTLIEENPNVLPTGHTPRMFLAFWWLFAMVITCGYDTKLISFLVNPEYEKLPGSFMDMLLWEDGWLWGMSAEQAPFLAIVLDGVGGEELEFLLQLIPNLDVLPNLTECMAKPIEADFSCLSALSILTAESGIFADKEGYLPTCAIQESGIMQLGPALSKHSILAPVFHEVVLKFWESGLLPKFEADYVYGYFIQGLRQAREENRLYKTSMALKFTQLKGPVYFLIFFGWGVGLAVFICEMGWPRRNSRQDISR